MKFHYLIFSILLFLGCNAPIDKKEKIGIKTNNKSTITIINESEYLYVNASSGLNYRKTPKGEILGKFKNNDKLKIVKHTNIHEEIKDDDNYLKGEWVGVQNLKDTVYVFDAFLLPYASDINIWKKFPLRKKPIVDTTNFDNLSKKDLLSTKDIGILQLKKIYPDLDKENYSYTFMPSYSIKFADFFKTIVINVESGSELEAVLINYNDKDELISHKVISYDEIAEGWSRKSSTIKNDCITTIDALYTDEPKIDTILYHINRFGYINKVKTKFKSSFYPNKNIKIGKVYKDTMQFLRYNDNSDYFFLEGKKNSNDVQLIYNWDVIEKYNFKKNDVIKISWKIDSSWVAGDGGTLDFSEFVIDAEKIK